VSSQLAGSIEMMLHRRTTTDDQKGLYEALNDTSVVINIEHAVNALLCPADAPALSSCQVSLPHGLMYHASAQAAELMRQRATVAFRNPLLVTVATQPSGEFFALIYVLQHMSS